MVVTLAARTALMSVDRMDWLKAVTLVDLMVELWDDMKGT